MWFIGIMIVVLWLSVSFTSLIGSITGKFYFPEGNWLKSSPKIELKKYIGFQARIWGLILFIGFAIFPIISLFIFIQNKIQIIALLFISLLISILFKRWIELVVIKSKIIRIIS